MALNVNREVSDDFYRYKMPRLIAKVEGKGNGIKTVIVNMQEVGKALCRPPIYPTKYFGAELGAQIQFDQKNERYIVNGAHDGEKLQGILDGFIKRYVLCSECENPETDLIVKTRGKQGELFAKCKACGYVGTVIDNSRTTQFIIKNPPDETGLALAVGAGGKAGAGAGGKGAGKKRRGGGAAAGAPGTAAGADRSPEGGNSDDNEDKADGGGGDADAADDDNGHFDSDNGDWDDGGGEEGNEELPDSIRRLIVTEELELTPQDRADKFHKLLSDKLAAGFSKDTPSELVREADRLDIRDKAVMVVAEVLLSNPATLVTDITKKYRSVFLAFTSGSPRSQKYLIGAVESLIHRYRDALLDSKRIPNLLNAFYNADLLSEETLVEWDEKGPSKRYTGDRKLSKQIHELAKPFINWLKTADEESSDEEEDDTAKIDNNNKPAANGNQPAALSGSQSEKGSAVQQQQKQQQQKQEEAEHDSDVDIDNI